DRIPAASAGTMNSLSLSGGAAVRQSAERSGFTYYETVAGGSGASASGDGESGVQTHMTNTLNTPAEALEMDFPLRVRTYAVERGTGGDGRRRGGDGLRREIEALVPMTGTILADRRRRGAYGLAGGGAGRAGRTEVVGADGSVRNLNGKDQFELRPGERLRLVTPGGGGHGSAGAD
ncbi:MAG: hydantoinase B/oxoprolinase family protein, partial [Phycisphaerales bacterium]